MADPGFASYDSLIQHVAQKVRAADRRPFLLGISGPPATGKSTLAQRLATDLTGDHGLNARFCPMDGFHLPNDRLDALGLLAVKGRIDTFDAEALLWGLKRAKSRAQFWWPDYSRDLHEPVAMGTRVTGDEDVCVIEGNYLLADAPVWRDIARLLDLRVFIDAPDGLLRARLSRRHHASGRSLKEAQNKITNADMPNAALIRAGRASAEIIIEDAGRLELSGTFVAGRKKIESSCPPSVRGRVGG